MGKSSENDLDNLVTSVGFVFGVIALIFLTAGTIVLVAAIFGLGIISNLALRAIPNQFDWREVDRDWIWPVIGTLTLVPMSIGLAVVLGPVIVALFTGYIGALSAWLAIPVYLVWLAGYLWSWSDPRFEDGMADTVMASTFAFLRMRFDMWWTLISLRVRLFFYDLGI